MIDVRHTKPSGKEERIRKMAPGTTRTEAEAYEREVIASLINGTYGSHEEREMLDDRERLDLNRANAMRGLTLVSEE